MVKILKSVITSVVKIVVKRERGVPGSDRGRDKSAPMSDGKVGEPCHKVHHRRKPCVWEEVHLCV